MRTFVAERLAAALRVDPVVAAGTVALKYLHLSIPTIVLTGWQHLIGVDTIVAGTLVYDIRRLGEVGF